MSWLVKWNNKLKLTIELVPKTCWFSNVRDHVSKAQWDMLRRMVYKKANYICEICGSTGDKWPVECHEIWEYNDSEHIQKLIGMIALCPKCHEVKHIGLASIRGRSDYAKEHLLKVNNFSVKQVNKYIENVFELWEERSEYEWKLDFSYLEQFLIYIKSKMEE